MPDDAYDPYADGDDDDFEEDGDEFDAAGEEEGEEEEDGEAKPAVFVTTAQAVAIRVDRLTDERAPEGSALATYIDDQVALPASIFR